MVLPVVAYILVNMTFETTKQIRTILQMIDCFECTFEDDWGVWVTTRNCCQILVGG